MSRGDLEFVLDIDSKNFNIKMKNAGQVIDTLQKRASSGAQSNRAYQASFNSLGGSVTNLVTTFGLLQSAIRTVYDLTVGWQAKIVSVSAQMERTRVMLEGMAKSTDKAAESQQNMNYIIDKARNAPFSIEAITDSFVKLKSAGIDPTNGSMNALIDGVAAFGGDSDILKRATIALQQMAGKGVVSMEELRQQLGEAIPTAMRNMASGMGITISTLSNTVSKGVVEARNAVSIMLTEMELKFGGSAERLMSTVSGAFAQVETAAIVLADELGKAGYNKLARDLLLDFKDILSSQEVKAFAMDFLNSMQTVIDVLKSMFNWVWENKYVLIELGTTLLKVFAASVVIKSIKNLIGLFGNLYHSLFSVGTVLASVFTGLKNFGTAAKSLGTATTLTQGLSAGFASALGAWKALDFAVKFSVIGSVLTVITGLAYTLYEVFGDISGKLDDIRERGSNIPSTLTNDELGILSDSIDKDKKKVDELDERIDMLKQKMAEGKIISYGEKKGGYGGYTVSKELERALKERAEVAERLSNDENLIYEATLAKNRQDTDKHYSILERKTSDYLNLRQQQFNKASDEFEQKRQEIKNSELLSEEEKQKQLTELAEQEQNNRKSFVEDRLSQWQKMYDDAMSKANLITQQLESPDMDKTSSEFVALNGQLASATEHANKYKKQIEAVVQTLSQLGAMGKGALTLDGNYIGDISQNYVKDAEKMLSQINRAAAGARASSTKWFDGTAVGGRNEQLMYDKIQAQLEKRGITYDELSKKTDEESKKLINLYVKIRETAKLADEGTKKTSDGTSKLATQFRNAENSINSAEQMLSKFNSSNTEIVKFDQQVEKLRASLEKIAHTKASTKKDEDGNIIGITQDQVDTAKQQLKELDEGLAEYRESLVKTSTLNFLNKKVPFAFDMISQYKQTTEESKAEFEKQFKLADETFKKIINAYEEGTEERKIIDEKYQLFLKSKNDAMVAMTGTACEKMIHGYMQVAEKIDQYFANAFEELGDTLTEFITTGEVDWKEFSNYLYKEFMRMVVNTQLIAPLMQLLGLGSDATSGSTDNWLSNLGSLFNLTTANNEQTTSSTDIGGTATIAAGAVGAAVLGSDDSEKSAWDKAGDMFSKVGDSLEKMWDSFSENCSDFLTSFGDYAGVAWDSITSIASSVWETVGDGFGDVINFVGEGFSSLLNSLGGSGGSGGFWGAIGSGLSAYFGGGSGAAITASANGNIMTSAGPLPLKEYANGGIARKPQLSLFGEGKLPEAYVPLPDGRSIPVSFKDSFAESNQSPSVNSTISTDESNTKVMININLTNYNGEVEDEEEQTSGNDNNEMKELASKVKSLVLETISEQKRPNGAITKRNMR